MDRARRRNGPIACGSQRCTLIMRDRVHIAILSADNDAAIAFYTEVLGFTVTFRRKLTYPNIDYALVCLGTCVIELLQPLDGSDPEVTYGLHHFAISVRDVDAAVADLRVRTR